MFTFLEAAPSGYRLSRLLLPLFLVTTVFASSLSFDPSPQSSSRESSVPIYHSTASEVRLVFFATDEHNHSVQELHQDDFAVVDDDRVIREFRSFTRSTLTKLDVVVLLDCSGSVLPYLRQQNADVLQLISTWSWTPGDNVSVFSFNCIDDHMICSGNCRSALTDERVAYLPSGGATPLFDALEIAASSVDERRQPDVLPVIMLFSDGDDTISKSSFPEAMEKLLASGAQVYSINVGGLDRTSDGTSTLQKIADDTGGRYVLISEGAVRIFSDVIDDLHSARVVTYPLPKSGTDFHSIRILPTHNVNLQFHSRRGYYTRSGNAP